MQYPRRRPAEYKGRRTASIGAKQRRNLLDYFRGVEWCEALMHQIDHCAFATVAMLTMGY
jgi:hypothetical protein